MTDGNATFRCACSPADEQCDRGANFCTTTHSCYASVVLESDIAIRRRGCLGQHMDALLSCRTNPGSYVNVECCQEEFCNEDLHPTFIPQPTEKTITGQGTITPGLQLSLVVLLPCLFLLIALPIAFVICRQRHFKRMRDLEDREKQVITDRDLRPHAYGQGTLKTLLDMGASSGSGSGVPLLVQRTVARQVSLTELIGKGRYGEVWRGLYHGENVAVKIFSSRDEASWKRETDIYNTVLLRHENILGFIASDMTSKNSCTQLWLIVHYHKLGSLYDYLNTHQVDQAAMLQLIHSAASGIVHLHTEIFGTQGKPAIAHRDIKSKNILVKQNGQCCIADLGLAVMHSQLTNNLDISANNKVGTRRYMAPELLESTMKFNCFESYKQADVYSFSLVMWEVTKVCLVNGACDEYRIPFHDCVPSDPTFDEMKLVVCDKCIRPEIPHTWSQDITLTKIEQLIKECWNPRPAARLTMLRLKKTLSQLKRSSNMSTVYTDHSKHFV